MRFSKSDAGTAASRGGTPTGPPTSTAIDPFEDAIARAQKRLSEAPNERIEFRHVSFEDLADASDADVFDVALLSWSLC